MSPILLPYENDADPCPGMFIGYADSTYSPQYAAQAFTTQSTESAASQINQLAFAANNAAAGQYLAAQAASNTSINVLSYYPSTGTQGTRVTIKVSTPGDFLSGSMSSSGPFTYVLFGSHRCTAEVAKSSQDGNGIFTYTITSEAPQFLSTTCPSLSNVPLTVLVESGNGGEMARVNGAGVFSYHDAQGSAAGRGVGAGGSGDASPPDLGTPKNRSPVPRASPPHQNLPVSTTTSSPPGTRVQSNVPVTSTYGFPPSLSVATSATAATTTSQPPTQTQSDFVTDNAVAYSQGAGNMMGTFRTSSFPDHYPRVSSVLRSPHGASWTPFSHLDAVRGSGGSIAHAAHTSITRPTLNPLHHTNSSAPQLFRTSTLGQPGGSGSGGGAGGYSPFPPYQTKATLNIHGDLGSMAEGWTHEEWENKRRLVLFKKHQSGSVLTTTFKPVSISERPPNSILISCIWWEEKSECFVTSVDTIHLLEQLVAAPNRFSVEEKNRIRRNLEGFHPLTVSKAKAESEEFFKVIMSFGNPKPRNIEKDVKVFPWKVLGQALTKIISKYSASTANLATPSNPSHMLTPVSLGSPYPALPPSSGSVSNNASTADVVTAAGYMSSGHRRGGSMGSPGARSLAGSTSLWSAYGGAGSKVMSPSVKAESPLATSGLRISTLPAVYDSRGSTHSLMSPYGVSSAATHHGSHGSQGGYGQASVPVTQSSARSWEAYSVPESYPAHTTHSHNHVYNGGAYGEGTQRA